MDNSYITSFINNFARISKVKLFIIFIFGCQSTYAYSYFQKDTITLTLTPSKSDFNVIQKALENKSGRNLKIILKGNFKINKTLSTSRHNTIIEFAKNSSIRTSSSENGILGINHDNCIVKNGKFIGNGLSSKDFYSGFGIILLGSHNSKIINCVFESISGNNIFLYPSKNNKSCNNNQIKDNLFVNPSFNISKIGDESAILLGYSGEGYSHDNNLIEGNVINGGDKLKVGIGIVGHGKNNIIRNNTISNVIAYGILSYESANVGGTLLNTQILNNKISNVGEINNKRTSKGMGIYLMTAENSMISGNKLSNTLRNSDESETLGAGAISVSLSPNCVIKDNMIDNSYMYGITSDYSFRSKFINNTIRSTRKSGMYFVNMSEVDILNNKFYTIGDVVIKGIFENTSLQYIKDQMTSKNYVIRDTGNDFVIMNNIFYEPKDVLYFVGTPEDKEKKYPGNMVKNNIFKKNKIVGNKRQTKELVNFRLDKFGTNIID